jgi:8-oxo-dGTP diphosphatase
MKSRVPSISRFLLDTRLSRVVISSMICVRVGVSVIIVKDGKVLLGMRKNSHGAGTWAFPGGHLEIGESFVGCATRELREETGMDVPPNRIKLFPHITNDIFDKDRHYITVYAKTRWRKSYGSPRIMEPNKCNKWQWFDNVHEIPSVTLFLPVANLIKQLKIEWI